MPQSKPKKHHTKTNSFKDLKALALAKQWARAQARTQSITNKGCNNYELSQHYQM